VIQVSEERFPMKLLRGRFITGALYRLAWGASALTLQASAAAAGETTAVGTYSGGYCELSVLSAKQEKWPVGGDEWSVGLQLQFRLSKPKPGLNPQLPLPLLPDGYYLNNQQSPLIAASAQGKKKNLAKEPHSGVTIGPGTVLVANLRVGPRQERLEHVEFELELAKITEWETLTFRIGTDETQVFRCGPFELKVTAEATRLEVNAGVYPEFARDHDAYRRRLPLNHFLRASYASVALRPADSAGRIPASVSESSTMAPGWKEGVTTMTFSGWTDLTTGVRSDKREISYPVSLSLKMPKRYETEKIRFHFDRIDLPAAK
jgi:hypothetical protein